MPPPASASTNLQPTASYSITTASPSISSSSYMKNAFTTQTPPKWAHAHPHPQSSKTLEKHPRKKVTKKKPLFGTKHVKSKSKPKGWSTSSGHTASGHVMAAPVGPFKKQKVKLGVGNKVSTRIDPTVTTADTPDAVGDSFKAESPSKSDDVESVDDNTSTANWSTSSGFVTPIVANTAKNSAGSESGLTTHESDGVSLGSETATAYSTDLDLTLNPTSIASAAAQTPSNSFLSTQPAPTNPLEVASLLDDAMTKDAPSTTSDFPLQPTSIPLQPSFVDKSTHLLASTPSSTPSSTPLLNLSSSTTDALVTTSDSSLPGLTASLSETLVTDVEEVSNTPTGSVVALLVESQPVSNESAPFLNGTAAVASTTTGADVANSLIGGMVATRTTISTGVETTLLLKVAASIVTAAPITETGDVTTATTGIRDETLTTVDSAEGSAESTVTTMDQVVGSVTVTPPRSSANAISMGWIRTETMSSLLATTTTPVGMTNVSTTELQIDATQIITQNTTIDTNETSEASTTETNSLTVPSSFVASMENQAGTKTTESNINSISWSSETTTSSLMTEHEPLLGAHALPSSSTSISSPTLSSLASPLYVPSGISSTQAMSPPIFSTRATLNTTSSNDVPVETQPSRANLGVIVAVSIASVLVSAGLAVFLLMRRIQGRQRAQADVRSAGSPRKIRYTFM